MSPATASLAKSSGPGRPKDLEKRAAILCAAKRLFPSTGFEGTSMDAVAAEAGVSKLTVYSHFNDKETLFAAAILARCQEQMPDALFTNDGNGPVRRQLEAIASAFFGLIMQPEAISLHRLVTAAGTGTTPKLAQLFWDAGPRRVHDAFSQFLRTEVAAGQLEVHNVSRAASQFFAMLKGELHARLLCGCTEPLTREAIDDHVRATVEVFLRAYAADPARNSSMLL